MGVGVLTVFAALVMWMGFLTAQHHFSAEAKLISVDVKEQTRLKDKNDPNYSKNDRYEKYYSYKLTWQFMNPDSEKKYTFIREEEASHPNAHEYGEKQTVFIYYNGDESDYEIMDYFASVIVALVGIALIVFPLADVIRVHIKRKKIEERDRKAAIKRASS